MDETNNVAIALTVAGSDSSGGAGIQADLKTFSALGVFATTVITAITAQNLKEIFSIETLPPPIVGKQLSAVLAGYPVAAAKTGMLSSSPIIETIADILSESRRFPLVIDPVMKATTGRPLLDEPALNALTGRLFPLAVLITPNVPEAEHLTGMKITSVEGQEKGARELYSRFGIPFLLKGGHLPGPATDILFDGKSLCFFESPRINEINTHGSGCTLSAAITAFLARGFSLQESVQRGKEYLQQTLTPPLVLENSASIINHYRIRK